MSRKPAIERIIERLSAAYPQGLSPEECWPWPGPPTGGGYGQISDRGIPKLVHRVIFENANGELPPGHDVDHDCHNPDLSCQGGVKCPHRLCCNPDHLRVRKPVVNKDLADRLRKRGKFKTHCPKDHPYDDENTMRVTRIRNGKQINERQCKACNRARVYKTKTGSERPADAMESLSRAGVSICRRGHVYDELNTKHDTTTGKRRCRKCERLNDINSKRRKKGLEPFTELPEETA